MLRDDALIAYPTDSCYALGCRMDNHDGADRIRSIRQLDDQHHFTLVCADFAQLGQFVQLDNSAFRAIKAATPGPLHVHPARRPRRCRAGSRTPRRRPSACASPTTPSPRRCCASSASRCCPAPCCCRTTRSR